MPVQESVAGYVLKSSVSAARLYSSPILALWRRFENSSTRSLAAALMIILCLVSVGVLVFLSTAWTGEVIVVFALMLLHGFISARYVGQIWLFARWLPIPRWSLIWLLGRFQLILFLVVGIQYPSSLLASYQLFVFGELFWLSRLRRRRPGYTLPRYLSDSVPRAVVVVAAAFCVAGLISLLSWAKIALAVFAIVEFVGWVAHVPGPGLSREDEGVPSVLPAD